MAKSKKDVVDRRRFLKGAAAGGIATLAGSSGAKSVAGARELLVSSRRIHNMLPLDDEGRRSSGSPPEAGRA